MNAVKAWNCAGAWPAGRSGDDCAEVDAGLMGDVWGSGADAGLSGDGGGGGGGVVQVAAAAAPAAAAPAEAAAEEKEFFDIKLTSFDAKAKIKVIKEVRALTGLGLKEAKEVVEGAPSVLKKEVKKDEAEEIVKKLTELGAAAELE